MIEIDSDSYLTQYDYERLRKVSDTYYMLCAALRATKHNGYLSIHEAFIIDEAVHLHKRDFKKSQQKHKNIGDPFWIGFFFGYRTERHTPETFPMRKLDAENLKNSVERIIAAQNACDDWRFNRKPAPENPLNKLFREYKEHKKALAMIKPQKARNYSERHGTSKDQDTLYHQACLHEIEDKFAKEEINKHKKTIAMIEPQNSKRFLERNRDGFFMSKQATLQYHRACIKDLEENPKKCFEEEATKLSK